eukprot:jgi/Hompol1/3643/HPOL_000275-RA
MTALPINVPTTLGMRFETGSGMSMGMSMGMGIGQGMGMGMGTSMGLGTGVPSVHNAQMHVSQRPSAHSQPIMGALPSNSQLGTVNLCILNADGTLSSLGSLGAISSLPYGVFPILTDAEGKMLLPPAQLQLLLQTRSNCAIAANAQISSNTHDNANVNVGAVCFITPNYHRTEAVLAISDLARIQ